MSVNELERKISKMQEWESLAEEAKADAEALAAQIAAITDLSIAAKVSENGTVFGSVNAAQIAEALAAKGVTVDRKNIEVAPVKEVGKYNAKINLHKEVSVELPFEVVAE